VDAGDEEICTDHLTGLIQRIIQDINVHGMRPAALAPVEVEGVRKYFFARSHDTVEQDARAFCRTERVDSGEGQGQSCVDILAQAAHQIYASRA
jgi:hypothetical protein